MSKICYRWHSFQRLSVTQTHAYVVAVSYRMLVSDDSDDLSNHTEHVTLHHVFDTL